jgi:hypothetical protein
MWAAGRQRRSDMCPICSCFIAWKRAVSGVAPMSFPTRKRWAQLFVTALCLCVVCVLAGCDHDRTESFYPSLVDAEKDGAIERRWLPDVLPQSSRNIHVAGDLSPSRVWCVFEFLPADSEQMRKALKSIDNLPPVLANVPKPGKPWWPPLLEGDFDLRRLHEVGLQLYIVEEPATASTTTIDLFAINWVKGRGFMYRPPA